MFLSCKKEDDKIKFEYLLEKKCKELEQLGDALVVKETNISLTFNM